MDIFYGISSCASPKFNVALPIDLKRIMNWVLPWTCVWFLLSSFGIVFHSWTWPFQIEFRYEVWIEYYQQLRNKASQWRLIQYYEMVFHDIANIDLVLIGYSHRWSRHMGAIIFIDGLYFIFIWTVVVDSHNLGRSNLTASCGIRWKRQKFRMAPDP